MTTLAETLRPRLVALERDVALLETALAVAGTAA